MSKSRSNNPVLDKGSRYVLRWRSAYHEILPKFVSAITPITYSQDIFAARVFEGRWLNETVWSWHIFNTPVEHAEAMKKFSPQLKERKKEAKKERKDKEKKKSMYKKRKEKSQRDYRESGARL
jgi:hypothetical protein